MRIFLARHPEPHSLAAQDGALPRSPDGGDEPIVWDTKGDREDDPLPASALVQRYPKVVLGRWYSLGQFRDLCKQPDLSETEVWADIALSVPLPERDEWVEVRCKQSEVVDSIVSEVIAFAEAMADGREWWIRVE